MDKIASLKDGTEVTMRPMEPSDVDRCMAFFGGLPLEDRRYLRADVTRREVIERRIRQIEAGNVCRLVALSNDEIVADGALELSVDEWMAHIAELRLIVARPFQRRGLGMLMARELYALAASRKVEQIVVRMARPQIAARNIFRKLGFRQEMTIPDHLKDLSGGSQDLVMMRCDLEAAWRTLEEFFSASDWQRTR